MDMIIAGVPAFGSHVGPTLQRHYDRCFQSLPDSERPSRNAILRSFRGNDLVIPDRKSRLVYPRYVESLAIPRRPRTGSGAQRNEPRRAVVISNTQRLVVRERHPVTRIVETKPHRRG